MSDHALEIFFYAGSTLMFAIFGFVPQVYVLINKHALLPVSDRVAKLFQKFSIFGCVVMFCQLIWAIWKALR